MNIIDFRYYRTLQNFIDCFSVIYKAINIYLKKNLHQGYQSFFIDLYSISIYFSHTHTQIINNQYKLIN